MWVQDHSACRWTCCSVRSPRGPGTHHSCQTQGPGTAMQSAAHHVRTRLRPVNHMVMVWTEVCFLHASSHQSRHACYVHWQITSLAQNTRPNKSERKSTSLDGSPCVVLEGTSVLHLSSGCLKGIAGAWGGTFRSGLLEGHSPTGLSPDALPGAPASPEGCPGPGRSAAHGVRMES